MIFLSSGLPTAQRGHQPFFGAHFGFSGLPGPGAPPRFQVLWRTCGEPGTDRGKGLSAQGLRQEHVSHATPGREKPIGLFTSCFQDDAGFMLREGFLNRWLFGYLLTPRLLQKSPVAIQGGALSAGQEKATNAKPEPLGNEKVGKESLRWMGFSLEHEQLQLLMVRTPQNREREREREGTHTHSPEEDWRCK